MILGTILAGAWNKLLGLGGRPGADLGRAQYYFAGGWPFRSAILILAAGVIWFGYLYLRDGTRPTLAIKTPLLVLRMIALAALLVMLLQPMLRFEKSDRIRSNAIVLVDESMSMAIRDIRLPADRTARLAPITGAPPATLTRAEIAQRIMNQRGTSIISELGKRYNVRLYKFNSDVSPVALPADSRQLDGFKIEVSPDPKRGTSTQLGGALKRALDDVAGQPVAGALLITDGGNNQGDDPPSVAERAKEQGVKVSAVGIGDPTPTRDIAITEVLADQVVRKDNIVQIFAGIAQRGYTGRTISVVLRRGNAVIGTKTLSLGQSTQKQTVSFTYTPKQDGQFTYSVSTDVLPDEVSRENNRRQFLQRVISKKLKILYVEGEPRWEYRYLKNAILRDKQIQLSCILTTSSGKTGGEGNVPIFAFPPDEKSLFDFDIMILGDVPRAYFSDAQIRNIRRFVEDKGSSLVVICGEKRMPQEYTGSSLESLFPVVLGPVAESVRTPEPFSWELTPAGRQDPILQLGESSSDSARIWRELPGMNWNAGVERAKPGATVLAVNPERSNSHGKRIVIAIQSFGAGRCFFSTVDSTWRWRWKVGDRYFYRYWGHIIRTLTPQETPGGNRFAQVNSDRGEYQLGERISFHARLLDPFYHPVKSKQVVASMRGETGPATPVTLTAIPGTPGLYAGEQLADRLGKFEVSVESPAGPGAKATASFLVQTTDLEKQQPELNESLLRKIAATSGGAYYHPEDLRRWLDTLKANDLTIRSETEIELWDAPIFLLAFIVPLALEWFIRKRTGLL